jgi:hypothetical protein
VLDSTGQPSAPFRLVEAKFNSGRFTGAARVRWRPNLRCPKITTHMCRPLRRRSRRMQSTRPPPPLVAVASRYCEQGARAERKGPPTSMQYAESAGYRPCSRDLAAPAIELRGNLALGACARPFYEAVRAAPKPETDPKTGSEACAPSRRCRQRISFESCVRWPREPACGFPSEPPQPAGVRTGTSRAVPSAGCGSRGCTGASWRRSRKRRNSSK